MNSTANGLGHLRRASTGGLIAAFAMILILTCLAPTSEGLPASVSNDPFVAFLYRLASNI